VCPGGCLAFASAVSESPLAVSRTASSPWGAEGLRGARVVSFSPGAFSPDGTFSPGGTGPGGGGMVVVRGGLPRAEYQCAAIPPSSADPGEAGMPEAGCQVLSFSLVQLPGGRAGLFARSPEISADGTLSFEMAPHQSGASTFQVGSDRLFQAPVLYWRSPESGDLWYKSRQMKKAI